MKETIEKPHTPEEIEEIINSKANEEQKQNPEYMAALREQVMANEADQLKWIADYKASKKDQSEKKQKEIAAQRAKDEAANIAAQKNPVVTPQGKLVVADTFLKAISMKLKEIGITGFVRLHSFNERTKMFVIDTDTVGYRKFSL